MAKASYFSVAIGYENKMYSFWLRLSQRKNIAILIAISKFTPSLIRKVQKK